MFNAYHISVAQFIKQRHVSFSCEDDSIGNADQSRMVMFVEKFTTMKEEISILRGTIVKVYDRHNMAMVQDVIRLP